MKTRAQMGLVVALATVLTACGGGGTDELQQWMVDQRNQTRPKVEPIAEPKVFEPQSYEQMAAMDPFNKEKLTQALQRDGGKSVANAALVAPEFQITSETSAAGSLNFFHDLFQGGGYGWPEEHRVRINLDPLRDLAATPERLVDELDLLFFNLQMSASTRQRLLTLINGYPATQRRTRVRRALTLVAMSPDFVIQR